jgi:hypothetical protein
MEEGMPQFEFKKSGPVRFVAVDGNELSFASGTATKNLVAGEYSVQWFARGDPGAEFSITVGLPGEKPKKEKKGTIDATRKAAGMFWLEVQP